MKYVDLFSGCGGLSLGIERAGGEAVVAVEKSEMAARTYFHNFVADATDPAEWTEYVAKPLLEQYKHGVIVTELQDVLRDDEVMRSISDENIDLVVGGPPCQGFSLAGRRNPEDTRNKLPWQYLEFVERVAPKAVVIENVVGMNQRFAAQQDSSFVQLQEALSGTGSGYVVQAVEVNAKHYGAPQHRPRLMIIAVRRDVAMSRKIESSQALWRSRYLDELSEKVPSLAPKPTMTSWEAPTVRDAIADLRLSSSAWPDTTAYVALMKDSSWPIRAKASEKVKNHLPRKHGDLVRTRFRLYQFLSANGIEGRFLSRLAQVPLREAYIYAESLLGHLEVPAYAPDGALLATSVKELVDLAVKLRTKKHSQKVLLWERQARTVVTLPDDYVHPEEPRIFTVRELARFQGFPDEFEFMGKETTGAHRRRVEVPQYSQVGNAVSPWLSLAVGKTVATVLES